MNMLKIRNAAIVGFLPFVLEGILIYSVEPNTDIWLLLQAVLAWFSFGFVVYLIDKGNKVVLNSIWLTILLNIPWYIAESVVKNKLEHLAPLIIASIVMGVVIGIASKLVDKKLTTH